MKLHWVWLCEQSLFSFRAAALVSRVWRQFAAQRSRARALLYQILRKEGPLAVYFTFMDLYVTVVKTFHELE